MSSSSRPSLVRILPWIVLAHVVLFLAFWLTNSLFYSSTNDYLAGIFGARWDYISLVLLLSAYIGLWSGARLVAGRLRWKHGFSPLTLWLYRIFALACILFFYGSFAILFHEDPVQLPRLIHLLTYFGLVLYPALFLCLGFVLSRWARGSLSRREGTGQLSRIAPLGLALIVCAAAWCLPLLFPPGSVYRGALPEKPRIIAHRGASMIAPENTLASAEQAAALGVYGLETDIHISSDGAPFLMHDDTLKRTTDVAQVFPGRERERAENFTLAEVSQLNAGKWFVDQDPFKTIARGDVPPQEIETYLRQPVPTLAEELKIVRDNGLIFIFDLKQPPAGSPYRSSFFDICLKQIQQAGIDAQVWFLVNQDEIQTVRAAAPQMKPASGVDYQNPPPPFTLKTFGYQVINAEYPLSARWVWRYQAAGLWVNLYTVDEPWQFSRLWLLGVNSITTSNAQVMVALSRPLLSLPYQTFLALWIAVGLVGLILLSPLVWRSDSVIRDS